MTVKPRLFVLTDIGGDPDDAQSLVRLLFHADQFDIEGLCATSRMGHGHDTRPELIRERVEAYGQLLPALRRHASEFPDVERLRSVIGAGQPVAGPNVAVERCVGEGRSTDASERLISALRLDDPRPLHLAVWGGTADLAQALHTLSTHFPETHAARLRSKLRVFAIADQDATGTWIRGRFPDVRYLIARTSFRGMYRGGDRALCDGPWVERHVHPAGPLGAMYPNYDGSDVWWETLGGFRGVKEGDTPSVFFHLGPPWGPGDPSRPYLGGWGGRYQGAGYRYADADPPDEPIPAGALDPTTNMASVYRWRRAYQAAFAARCRWVTHGAAAESLPSLRVSADRVGLVAGRRVELRAQSDAAVSWSWMGTPAGPWADPAGLKLEANGPSAIVSRPPGHRAEIGEHVLLASAARESGLTTYAHIGVVLPAE